MSHEDKYDYYRIKSEFVKGYIDEYTVVRKKMYEEIKEAIKKIGASGVVQSESIFKTTISAFSFSKDCKFDFKFSSTKIGNEVIIKPYRNSKTGKAFSEKMNSEIKKLNDKYKGKITIGDWLIKKFNCYRDDIVGNNLLVSWAGADSKKGLIMLKIPKEGKHFNPPNEFEKITYGKFYDLANG